MDAAQQGAIAGQRFPAKVGALSIEFANPRHQHEYAAFKKHPFPKDKILIPGVVTHHTTTVEHPRLVAETDIIVKEPRSDSISRRNAPTVPSTCSRPWSPMCKSRGC